MTFYDFPECTGTPPASRPLPPSVIGHEQKAYERDSLLHMMFKLGQCAEKNWRKLRGFASAKIVKFINGEEIEPLDFIGIHQMTIAPFRVLRYNCAGKVAH